MLEGARILAVAAGVVLIIAVAAWARIFRRPALRRLDGSVVNEDRAKLASRLLAMAVGASAVAAVMATLDLLGR
ncbi:hypothetical protein H9L13_11380 [Sphingomonas lutea]|uniref:Uncharacterized protein n=1 Tax=Sphingomonas lutea TaxID=1045317 RepID=A0A7G9SH78_9SPHN|nr:hypothetical protein [Sphingomonas lutea]QNN67203.1 hypothetical protein H9L13_11380 [Sphingomonas lutea]